MCLGMNDDIARTGRALSPRRRTATSKAARAQGARTHLVSPAMAAAAAIGGHFVDVEGAVVNPLRRVTGPAAVLDRADVDTDQIIPKQFLKRIERTGFGEFLFFDWMSDPDFELRQPEAQGASILIAGANFGCGSSREHAPWALEDYGFRVILAPSYGDIFRTNCVKTGVAPIVLAPAELEQIRASLAEQNELTVDLEALEITAPTGLRIAFVFDAFERECLLNGLDDVALTLERDDAISAYESTHAARFDTRALAG